MTATATIDIAQILGNELYLSKNIQREVCHSTLDTKDCTTYSALCYADGSFHFDTAKYELPGFNNSVYTYGYLGTDPNPYLIFTTSSGLNTVQITSKNEFKLHSFDLEIQADKIFVFSFDGRSFVAVISKDKTEFFEYHSKIPGCYAQIGVLNSICPVDAADCPADLKYGSSYPFGSLSSASAKLYGVSFATNSRIAIEVAQNWGPESSYVVHAPMGQMNYISSICYQQRCWMNVMPNSKLYILPYPLSKPKNWRMRVDLPFEWRSVSIAVIVMVCVLVVGVLSYIILVRREMQEDRREASTVARLFAHK